METSQERRSPLPANRQKAARFQTVGLRNWPVRSKLIAVLAIPALVLLVLASINVKASLNDAQSLRTGGELARLERSSTALVHELQLERDLTAGVIAGKKRSASPSGNALTDLANQRGAVDQAAAAFTADLAGPRASASPAIRAQLDDVRAELAGLNGLRTAITRRALTQQAILDEYSQLVDKLLGIDLQAALRGGDERLAQQVQSFSNLSRAKELTSQVRGTLYAIAVQGRFGFGQFQTLADLLAQRQAALDQFVADADEQQRGLFAASVKGQAVLTVQRIQQAAVDRQAQRTLGIDPDQWLAASTTEIELQRTVETQLLSTVIQRAEDLSGDAQLRSLRDAGLIAIALAVALLGALAVAQSMVRPLQRLRRNAMEVAEHRLPEAVHQTAAGQVDVQVVRIGETARDEIGEVARAVDVIHMAAVDLATEQAALRRSISEMFLNLARRSQTLIDRLLEQIDDLEREADADTLEKLFGVDHLATRLRRTAEGLIVLSGAPDPPRRWLEAIPLMDVVRGAVQEVEDYQRVEVLPIDNVQLTGYAVSEVVHLLAELVENATRFSPPGTVVRIGGQPSATGHVIRGRAAARPGRHRTPRQAPRHPRAAPPLLLWRDHRPRAAAVQAHLQHVRAVARDRARRHPGGAASSGAGHRPRQALRPRRPGSRRPRRQPGRPGRCRRQHRSVPVRGSERRVRVFRWAGRSRGTRWAGRSRWAGWPGPTRRRRRAGWTRRPRRCRRSWLSGRARPRGPGAGESRPARRAHRPGRPWGASQTW